MMKYCYSNNVPMVAFVSSADNKDTQYCVHCRNFATYILPNPAFIDFVKNNTSCVIMYIYRAATTTCNFGSYSSFMELAGDKLVSRLNSYYWEKGTFVIMLIAWRQKSGNIVQYAEQEIESLKRLPENALKTNSLQNYATVINTVIIPAIRSNTNGFNAYTEMTTTLLNSTLKGTGCFGLNHNVRIYGNDGKSVKFKPSGGDSVVIYS